MKQDGARSRYFPVIDYQFEGRSYRFTHWMSSSQREYKPGMQVSLVLWPGSPGRASLVSPFFLWVIPIVAIGFGCFLLGIVFLN